MNDPVARQHNAERLLGDELFNEAFEAVAQGIMHTLRGPATPHDVELLMALRLIPKIKGWIVAQAQSGKIELFEEAVKARKAK